MLPAVHGNHAHARGAEGLDGAGASERQRKQHLAARLLMQYLPVAAAIAGVGDHFIGAAYPKGAVVNGDAKRHVRQRNRGPIAGQSNRDHRTGRRRPEWQGQQH